MSKTSPSNIDNHIGYKLKMLRLKKGRSLSDIGNILGVSFQQIQKYEKGANKISSSNLFLLADNLDTSISYFFDDLNKGNNIQCSLNEEKEEFLYNAPVGVSDSELVTLVKNYSKIKDSNIRRGLLDLLKAL
ncbi:MAG: helix-turn-helix transcriptional regulator [Rickettsiales bacterium]|nr:helix-turn-helix transcriptional regulator [Rickettsiales bacterium]